MKSKICRPRNVVKLGAGRSSSCDKIEHAAKLLSLLRRK